MCCFQWFKDTNLKANHNRRLRLPGKKRAVFNGSKILIWKQITTKSQYEKIKKSCFQWFKDTNLKANHNSNFASYIMITAVFNGSKILIWKQITTKCHNMRLRECCFQWFKDTNLKANHNWKAWMRVVRQSCFQWFKDTNLKANHNTLSNEYSDVAAVFNGSKILIWKQITTWFKCFFYRKQLFSMVQRY